MVNLSSDNFSEFTFNGGAARVGQTLEFDAGGQEIGSAFFPEQIRLDEDTSFKTNFRYQSGSTSGRLGTDLTFILHNDPRQDNALSTSSSDSGREILSSLSIQLDNLTNDVNLNTNGNHTPLVSVPANLQLDSGGDVNVWIEYNGRNDRLEVFTSTTTTRPRNPLLSSEVDIEGIVGNEAYVGFGGWDSRGDRLTLLEWEFSASEPGPTRTINGNNRNNRLRGNNQAERIDGRNGNDILIGRGGDDELIGGRGNDTLTGGDGADDFLIGSNRAYRRADLGVDTIRDFRPNVDDIILDKDTFVTLHSEVGEGFSIGREFEAVKNKRGVQKSVADIVYDRATGDLYYNANGALPGFGGGGKIATLEGAPRISASDFVLE